MEIIIQYIDPYVIILEIYATIYFLITFKL